MRLEFSDRTRLLAIGAIGIVFDTQQQADTLVRNLKLLSIKHGRITVAEFYKLIKLEPNRADEFCGWYDTGSFGISKRPDGWWVTPSKIIVFD